MSINWKQKLTSRKFWAAIAAFAVSVLTAFGIEQVTIEQVTAIIAAVSTMIAYILGEGLVDSARIKAEVNRDEDTL